MMYKEVKTKSKLQKIEASKKVEAKTMYLENDLIDIGAATKDLERSAVRKRKVRGECKQQALDAVLKLQERNH